MFELDFPTNVIVELPQRVAAALVSLTVLKAAPSLCIWLLKQINVGAYFVELVMLGSL